MQIIGGRLLDQGVFGVMRNHGASSLNQTHFIVSLASRLNAYRPLYRPFTKNDR
jgi:hypothetical protein